MTEEVVIISSYGNMFLFIDELKTIKWCMNQESIMIEYPNFDEKFS